MLDIKSSVSFYKEALCKVCHKENVSRSSQLKIHHFALQHLNISLCVHGPWLDLDLPGLKLKVGPLALVARE